MNVYRKIPLWGTLLLMMQMFTSPAMAYEDTAALAGETNLPLTPEGNLTLVDDEGSNIPSGKQFITLVTKNGNFFYLIIDRDAEGENTVHFLNQVDEADLFSLLEKDEAVALQTEWQQQEEELQRQIEQERSRLMAEQEALRTESEDTVKEEPEKDKRLALLAVIILAAAIGGGVFFLLRKKKALPAENPDPDDYYGEEDLTFNPPEETAEDEAEELM